MTLKGFVQGAIQRLSHRELSSQNTAPDDELPTTESEMIGHDPLTEAVQEGLQADDHVVPSIAERMRASDLVGEARSGATEAAMVEILSFVRDYPYDEQMQIFAGRIAEATLGKNGAAAIWKGIHHRFPRSTEAFRVMLRWIVRDLGRDAGFRYLRAQFPESPTDEEGLLLYAWGCNELRDFEEADSAFDSLLEHYGRDEAIYVQYAQSLAQRGELWRAQKVLGAGVATFGETPKLAKSQRDMANDVATLEALAGSAGGKATASEKVLERIFHDIVSRRRPSNEYRSFVGPILMMIGSLGSGGAERQFTTTAKALQRAIVRGDQVAGYDVVGPIGVCTRSLRSREGADFFHDELARADIPVWQYLDFERFGGHENSSIVAELRQALRFLPHPIVDATVRLADALRHHSPDVVQIWQDGFVYATGLAALLAGVPRIVLNVRTMPPIDRPDRYQSEYELIFRSMLAAPNVRLVANSSTAARRYAEWLGMDPGLVHVVRNGVDPLPDVPSLGDEEVFARFASTTSDATLTVGGVMRLDDNKRPFLWLDSAAALLAQVPTARFVLVGDGPLRESAVAYAQRLGIAERVLFTGRSKSVGWWLRRMDAFVLLSRIEGLPNVLIEAQYAGVPVIATPAGGVAETLVQNETGWVLPSAESPNPRDVAGLIVSLVKNPALHASMRAAAPRWAEETFSVAVMAEGTVRSFMD